MKLFRSLFLVTVLLFSSLSVWAADSEIVIGAALPLSGPLQEQGREMADVLRLRLQRINEEGGCKGRLFRLDIRDDRDDPETAKQVAAEFVARPDVLGVIGHFNSSTALGGAHKIYDSGKLVNISPVSTNPEVASSSPWLFNANYSGISEGRFIAGYLKTVMKHERVAVIATNHRYGQRLYQGFSETAERIGLKIATFTEFDKDRGPDPDFIATRLGPASVDFTAIVVFAHTEFGQKVISQIRTSSNPQLAKLHIFGPESFVTPRFLADELEEVMKDVYVTSPFFFEVNNDVSFQLRQDFKALRNREPELVSALVVDGLELLVQAVEAVGPDRVKVRDFLGGLQRRNNVDSLIGATGEMFFDPARCMGRDTYVATIKDGRYKMAFVQLATVKETYVLKQLPERIKKGYIVMVGDVPYHWVDVVFVGVDVHRINDISPTSMLFDAELFLWFKWTNEAIDTSLITPINSINTEESFTTLFKENLSGETKYRCFQARTTFKSDFDLKAFPNDQQKLRIRVAHKNKNNSHLLLVPDTRHMTRNPIKEIFPKEWVFQVKNNYSGLHRYDSTFGDPDYRMGRGHKSKVFFSTVNFDIEVKRIIFPYLFSFFMPIFILIAITLFVFLIPVESFEVKLNTCMTSLLSLMVLNLSQNSSLPAVSYLMRSDYFFIASYIFNFSLIFEVIALNWLLKSGREDQAFRVKWWFSRIFVLIAISTYLLLFMKT